MNKSQSGSLAPAPTPAQPAREESSLIILGESINRIIEMKFEDATAQFHCLADLIAHHPGYRREAAAMRQLSAAWDILINTTREVSNL